MQRSDIEKEDSLIKHYEERVSILEKQAESNYKLAMYYERKLREINALVRGETLKALKRDSE